MCIIKDRLYSLTIAAVLPSLSLGLEFEPLDLDVHIRGYKCNLSAQIITITTVFMADSLHIKRKTWFPTCPLGRK
ncbi:hypothetical protein BDZ94DRAFT_449781 [Collybia nuda]|uniref:Uncharacterized protein n=1 Tax=Collybia nuda TaxID=64659 RepID=A0A9P5YA03_9AGAR|nr:hypothetical protein BDZ94DRAFT_449781 [Collybia nuda]